MINEEIRLTCDYIVFNRITLHNGEKIMRNFVFLKLIFLRTNEIDIQEKIAEENSYLVVS